MEKSKNREKYNKNSENKTEIIQVKVSPSEHKQIWKQAEEAGFNGRLSPYIRSQILHPCAAASEGKLRQKIVAMLCAHAKLVMETRDPELRQKYVDWEETVWLSIRS